MFPTSKLVMLAAAAWHMPVVAPTRLPMILEAAKVTCPYGNTAANDDTARALHLNLAEKAAMVAMCVMYQRGRISGLDDQRKIDNLP